MTRRILYRGQWYQVPCETRNDAYVRARNRGLSHANACRSGFKNWMVHHTIHPLTKAGAARGQ